jgi:hypothetical protein
MGKKLPIGAFWHRWQEEAANVFAVNNLRGIHAFEQLPLDNRYLRAA